MMPDHPIPDNNPEHATNIATITPPNGDRLDCLRPNIDRELQAMAARDVAENKRLKMAVLGAAVFHAVLLIVTFPEFGGIQVPTTSENVIRVLTQTLPPAGTAPH